ncbi:MAG: hypothetical protein PHP52_07540 [Bacteroidales bacterium]|nr:hypothetical protein [Bacteroidales bacterium]MDD4217073.1 hypothetical protein [Bacteroidales bacterium]MDY0142486.1 hypothetical protein [Bacteroidales bacterium]
MEHLKEIISLLSWPVMIYVSYRLVLLALKYFEKNIEKQDN